MGPTPIWGLVASRRQQHATVALRLRGQSIHRRAPLAQKHVLVHQMEGHGTDRPARRFVGCVVPQLRCGCGPRAISSNGMYLPTVFGHGPPPRIEGRWSAFAESKRGIEQVF